MFEAELDPEYESGQHNKDYSWMSLFGKYAHYLQLHNIRDYVIFQFLNTDVESGVKCQQRLRMGVNANYGCLCF